MLEKIKPAQKEEILYYSFAIHLLEERHKENKNMLKIERRIKDLEKLIPAREKAEVEGYVNILADNYGRFGLPQIERLKLKEKAYRVILYGIEEEILEKENFLIEDFKKEAIENYIEIYGVPSGQFRNYFKEALQAIRETNVYKNINNLQEKVVFVVDMLDILLTNMIKYNERGIGVPPKKVLEAFKKCSGIGENKNAANLEAKLKLLLEMGFLN